MSSSRVLIVAAEAYPLAKSGGLGDAVTGMARALDAGGAHVTVLMPAYRGVRAQLSRAREVAELRGLPGGPAKLVGGTCPQAGINVLLLENDALYDRNGLYADDKGDFPDNALRFAALAHAAARIAQGQPGVPRPDVVHAHDWHAALTPALMRSRGCAAKSVLTIHNLAFHGQFPLEQANVLDIPADLRDENGMVAWGKLNFMKAGLRYADVITTVSHTYSREILTPAFGCGLDGLLRERVADLVPIANGLDDTLWNPANDRHLGAYRYSARDPRNKAHCKASLQQALGLPVNPNATLIAMGSRLTHQKMADVAARVLPRILQAHDDVQVFVLGQGERQHEDAMRAMAEAWPDRCAVRIGYDEETAHQLHAGADILLHGSRFEPFGLTPLYAMRYGTLPIGSRVGGMADTIHDPGPRAPIAAMRTANGLLFDGEGDEDMLAAIGRALHLRRQEPIWQAMQRNAMMADFSWDSAVQPYLQLFESLSAGAPGTPQPARVRRVSSWPYTVPRPAQPGTPPPAPAAL
ncbi:MAG: glycogen synthase GlgA [Bordetella sp.]|nr:glycogen synthase GlgA [Bordetella sp.]